jgi:hypothetical protein
MHWPKAGATLGACERSLAKRLISGLLAIPSLTILGITDPTRFDQRVPCSIKDPAQWSGSDFTCKLVF